MPKCIQLYQLAGLAAGENRTPMGIQPPGLQPLFLPTLQQIWLGWLGSQPPFREPRSTTLASRTGSEVSRDRLWSPSTPQLAPRRPTRRTTGQETAHHAKRGAGEAKTREGQAAASSYTELPDAAPGPPANVSATGGRGRDQPTATGSGRVSCGRLKPPPFQWCKKNYALPISSRKKEATGVLMGPAL